MTLKMLLRWKNPDASTDINLRLRDVAAKGFLPETPSVPFVVPGLGAEIIPVPFVLQVTVTPFVMVNYDGAVVTSDAPSAALTVSDGQINYVVCRARYRLMDSPILQMQVLTQAAYLADPELPWLVVAGVVDLSVGGPYASVPTNRIFYEARDAIDEQTRSSWREPVANSGLLPIPPADHNRHGDVRLVTSTGSFYWWNDTASLWEVFDEVPVIVHRDYEHTNGITGDSAAGTLLPGVSGAGPGQNLTIAAVPAGSAYTVDGRLLQSPAAPLAILASSVGALRGLIRVEMDFLGIAAASYRASSGTANVDYARIVNMSDAHPAGLFTLDFTAVGGTLSWDNGPLVAVPVAPSGARRYRLYRPNASDWIEIVVNNLPAAPGINTNDIYTVTAPTDFETTLLVGYWFWDGSGAKPLIVGQDKRLFGNLAFPQMSTSFKDVQFSPPETELRGNMTYSGGTCTSLGGLNLQITGPIVSYIQGTRFETPAFFNGTVLLNNQLNIYIYVDGLGALQITVTNPATVFDADGRPLQYASVARVTTAGGLITVVDDERDPQLIVGNATRNSRLKFTGAAHARWNQLNQRVTIEENSSTAGVTVETGGYRAVQNRFAATTAALLLEDFNTLVTGTVTLNSGSAILSGVGTSFLTELPIGTKIRVASQSGGLPPAEDTVYTIATVTSNTAATLTTNYTGVSGSGKTLQRPQALSNPTDDNISALQPLNLTPSIIGAVKDVQFAKKFSMGIENGVLNTCAPSIAVFPNIQIDTGTFYDALGRRVQITTAVQVPITGTTADDVFAIVWDPDLNGGSFTFDRLDSGGGCDIQDLPFAVVQVNSTNTAFSIIENVRRFADGQYDRSFVTVGATQTFQRANFLSIRQAMLHIKCFDDDEPAPKIIRVVESYSEPFTASDTGCIRILPDATAGANNVWTQPRRLSGITVIGVADASAGSATSGRPTVSLSAGAGVNNTFFLDMMDSLNAIRNFSFENLNFIYAGGINDVTNHARTIFRNVGAGFALRNCFVLTGSTASHVFAWSEASIELGGDLGLGASSVETPGMLVSRCFMESITDLGGTVFYFGDGTGTNTGTVTNIDGRLVIDNCTIENASTDAAAFLISTPTEGTCDTDQFDIAITNTSIGRSGYIFNNCDNAAKFLLACELSNIATGISLGATRLPVITSSRFTGATANLTGAGNVVGCSLGENTVMTLASGAKLSACDFTLGTVTGVFESIVDSRINLGTTGILDANAYFGTANRQSIISGSVILKSNLTAQSNIMVRLASTNARAMLTDVRFSYEVTAPVSANTDPVVSITSPVSNLTMRGCELDVSGLRDSMFHHVRHTASSCSIIIEGCRFSGSTAAETSPLHVDPTSAGTNIVFSNNVVQDGGVSILASAAAARVNSLVMDGNRFGNNAPIGSFFERVRYLTITNNVWTASVGAGSTMFFELGLDGGAGGADARQETLVFSNNSINCVNAGVYFDLKQYKTASIRGNIVLCENMSIAQSIVFELTGQTVDPSVSLDISDNVFSLEASAAVAVDHDWLWIGVGWQSTFIRGNRFRAKSSGTVLAAIDVTPPLASSNMDSLIISDNRVDASTSTAVTSIARINVAPTSAQAFTCIVEGNSVYADGTGAGSVSGEISIARLSSAGALIQGNTVRTVNGVDTARISAEECERTIVIGNTIAGGDFCQILVFGVNTEDVLVSNNTLRATSDIDMTITADFDDASIQVSNNNLVSGAGGVISVYAAWASTEGTSSISNNTISNETGAVFLEVVGSALAAGVGQIVGNAITTDGALTMSAGPVRYGTISNNTYQASGVSVPVNNGCFSFDAVHNHGGA